MKVKRNDRRLPETRTTPRFSQASLPSSRSNAAAHEYRSSLFRLDNRYLGGGRRPKKSSEGMREAAIRGFWVSTYAPFGYRKVSVQDGAKKRTAKLELDPPADSRPCKMRAWLALATVRALIRKVIRRIFQMALQGKSTLDITKTAEW